MVSACCNYYEKMGEPKTFLILYSVGSYVVIRLGESGIKKVIKATKRTTKDKNTMKEYVVFKDGVPFEGVKLSAGD